MLINANNMTGTTMMNTFISKLFCLPLLIALFSPLAAYAVGAAHVMNTSGVVTAQRADGSVRALSKNSIVEVGEVITTGKGSYARFKFTDDGDLTLQPETTIKIDQYGFDEAKPEGDNFVYSLVKGGLRSITGKIGKRGNQDAYKMNTATATIGIRGTTWRSSYKPGVGLYLQVLSGVINARNAAGSLDFSAGMFGYVPSPTTSPTILPSKPDDPNLGGNDDDNDGGTGGPGCVTTGN